MEGWEGIQPADLVALRQRVRRENLQLDTESTFYSGMPQHCTVVGRIFYGIATLKSDVVCLGTGSWLWFIGQAREVIISSGKEASTFIHALLCLDDVLD